MREKLSYPRMALAFLVLALLGSFFYRAAGHFPFVHDDIAFIKDNPEIGRWDNIADVFFRTAIPLEGVKIQTPYYRPVLELLYRLQYAVFGMNPGGFHAVNVGFHIINSWLVWALLSALVGCSFITSIFCALVFLLHPVQVQAVACVSGISNLAVAFFLLSSFLCYVMMRGSLRSRLGWGIAAGSLFVTALFTKEIAVIFPLVLVLYEMTVGRKVSENDALPRWLPAAGFALVAAGFVVWRQMLFAHDGTGIMENVFEFKLRLLSIPAELLSYVRLMMWPADLHYYRSIDILAPKLVPALWFSVLTLLGILGYLRAPADMRPRLIFGYGFVLAGLLPVLNIVPLINEYSFVQGAEHYLYLPIFGVLVVVTAGLPLVSGIARREIMLIAAAGLVLACGLLTSQQVMVWRSEVALFERAAFFEPHLGRVRMLLARAYANTGRLDEAAREYSAALQIMIGYVKNAGHSPSGEIYAQFVKAIYFDRGQVFLRLGDIHRAQSDYKMSLAARSSGADTRWRNSFSANNLALLAMQLGNLTEAEHYFKLAVAIDDRNVDALNNLAMFYSGKKEIGLARYFLERALTVRPGFGAAWDNLKKLEYKK
ncbi:MAG: tetratricopeptide repeat protein [Candidatus Omnitrophica bacterium]|nr:tetratricopeptide repeat protein [Candidatus Omnitrophota bacterium]